MLIKNIAAFAWIVFLLLGAGGAGAVLRAEAPSSESAGPKAPWRNGYVSTGMAAEMQKGKITSPSVAAQRLYSAWKKKSKKAALKVASSEAVSKLLSTKWRPMKFKGCQNTGGSFSCVYHDPKLDLDLAMEVEGGASAGYHVESVSFSSEAARLPLERPQLASLSGLEQFYEPVNR